MEKIIVGVDGSATAANALRWAVDHADDDDVIVAAIAWSIPAVGGLELPVASLAQFEISANRAVKEAVTALDLDEGEPSVETRTVAGDARTVLSDLSGDADLVVVGSRGLGTMQRAFLGSVSDYVVHHAKCPVVVVPPATAAHRSRSAS